MSRLNNNESARENSIEKQICTFDQFALNGNISEWWMTLLANSTYWYNKIPLVKDSSVANDSFYGIYKRFANIFIQFTKSNTRFNNLLIRVLCVNWHHNSSQESTTTAIKLTIKWTFLPLKNIRQISWIIIIAKLASFAELCGNSKSKLSNY